MASVKVKQRNVVSHFLSIPVACEKKKSWIKRDFNKRLSLQISQKYSYSQLVSTLLASRDLDINNIDNFLKPTLKFFLPGTLKNI